MELCRICICTSECITSLNDLYNKKSYGDIITLVSGVKVSDSSNITTKICKPCSESLVDAYQLIDQIKNSEIELQRANNIKKLIFDNISDIKIQDGIEIKDVNVEFQKGFHVMSENFNGDKEIVIHDTVIKKMENNKNPSKNQLDLLQFLKSIDKNSYSDVDDMDYSVSVLNSSKEYDEEYKPNKTKKNIIKNTQNKTKKKSQNKENQIRIKPVVLKDYVIDLKDYSSIKTKPNKVKPKKSYRRMEMCPHCGKMTSSLKSHMVIHTDSLNYKCDECGKAMKSLERLKSHKKIHMERIFKCHICVASFNNKTCLNSHMLAHTNEKKCICDVCSKSFKRKSALRRHILIHNSANKRVNCDLCNMSFFDKYRLKHHMRVHTGERPYNCEICAQPYSYKHDFNRHCLKKHGVFLKRRQVNIMNEEVLKREKMVMKNLLLKINGQIDDGKPLNPFEVEGPQAAQAFELAVKALSNNIIPATDVLLN